MRAALAILWLVAALSAAHAFGLGEGNRFGRLGSIGKSVPPPSGCANNAPDGSVDLSKCSNAFYVAVIF